MRAIALAVISPLAPFHQGEGDGFKSSSLARLIKLSVVLWGLSAARFEDFPKVLLFNPVSISDFHQQTTARLSFSIAIVF